MDIWTDFLDERADLDYEKASLSRRQKKKVKQSYLIYIYRINSL